MSKTMTTGFISNKVNDITVNTSLKCNSSNYKNSDSRTVSYIVMHYTGNEKDTAKANANYFTGENRGASAHFFVDNSNIYQSVELRDTAWHCGTKGTYYHDKCRNANSIGIEMCCTAGDYKIAAATKKNAAYLCAYMCKLIGVDATQVDTYVLRHYDITHKKCPAQMVSNESEWTAFKKMVKNVLLTGNTEGTVATKTESKIKKGDLVKLSSSATYYDGKAIPTWVKNTKWYVSSVSGDRAVIDKSEDGKNSIASAVNVKYLTVTTATVVATPKIVKGSTVKIKSGATNYDGKKLASFLYGRNHKVKEIKGDRVVLTYLGIVVCAVKLSSLTLVK